MQRLLRRLGAAALGLVAALAVLEVVLQAGARLAAPTLRFDGVDRAGAKVLFVGDSHTFGVWVAAEEALPACAERLAVGADPPGFQAINLGRAGSPSWIVRAEAEWAVAALEPDAVVVRAGFNNRYAVPPEEEAWYDRLRVVKLARLAGHGLRRGGRAEQDEPYVADVGPLRRGVVSEGDGGPEPDHDLVGARFESYREEVSPRLRSDLGAVVGLARAAGGRVYVLPYASDAPAFAPVNADLAAVAAAEGATFVELAPAMDRAEELGVRRRLLFGDGHPRPPGYELEARSLLAAMQADGLVGGEPVEAPAAWLATLPLAVERRAPMLVLDRAAEGAISFRVRADGPGRGRLLLGAPGSGLFFGTEPLELRADAAALERAADPRLVVDLDERGTARIEVPEALSAGLGSPARAIFLLGDPSDPASWPPIASPPVDFDP